MAELTPGEKMRIFEEERIKHEIEQRNRRYRFEEARRPKIRKGLSKIHWAGISIGVIGLLLFIFAPKESSSPSVTVDRAPKTEKLLEISINLQTEKRPPIGKTEVWVKGKGSWFPDLKYGGDMREFGNYGIGESNEFYFYPDGRKGTEMRIRFRMTAEMKSGSTMSQTMIDIYDNRVEVVGQAIGGNSVEFKR